jgi:DnaJ-class molecular chaperone
MPKDYYRILGVLDDAEDIVIKAANKALAQRYHPDKWVGNKDEATRRMSDINEAYGVLSDPVKRKQYDSTRDKNSYQPETSKESDERKNKSRNNFRENSSNKPFKIKEIKRPRPGKKYF